MKAMAVKKRKEDLKVWLPPTHPGSQLRKTKKNKTNSPMLSEASAPIEVNVTAVAGSTSNVLDGRSTSIVLDRPSKVRLSTSKAALVPTAGWGSTSKAMMAAWASSQMMIQNLPAFGNCSFTRMLDVFLSRR